MENFKYTLTLPRLILFVVLFGSGARHFAVNGYEEFRPGENWFGLVLLVALLASIILRLAVKRKRKD